MIKSIRNAAILALAVSLAGAMSFAQSSGEATYKAKCAMCHGATGTPNAAMAKSMGIKAANDPDMKKLTVDQIVEVITKGKGKMKPVAGVEGAAAKATAEYYKNLGK